ncbi:SDR family oxidoreductase [Pseudonocardia sp. CA-142604]|uniref:SDR family oxidoreductase n=1 Tax=Pseudonocardia sp. CA-142604 TaxID=3240024 RepID=UPI003D8CBB57
MTSTVQRCQEVPPTDVMSAAVQALVDEGVSEFGRLDMVCANADIAGIAENTWTMTEDEWSEMIAVDLTGVWKTVKAAAHPR